MGWEESVVVGTHPSASFLRLAQEPKGSKQEGPYRTGRLSMCTGTRNWYVPFDKLMVRDLKSHYRTLSLLNCMGMRIWYVPFEYLRVRLDTEAIEVSGFKSWTRTLRLAAEPQGAKRTTGQLGSRSACRQELHTYPSAGSGYET